jgi:hypothetical protein
MEEKERTIMITFTLESAIISKSFSNNQFHQYEHHVDLCMLLFFVVQTHSFHAHCMLLFQIPIFLCVHYHEFFLFILTNSSITYFIEELITFTVGYKSLMTIFSSINS